MHLLKWCEDFMVKGFFVSQRKPLIYLIACVLIKIWKKIQKKDSKMDLT